LPFIYFEAQVPSATIDSQDKMALREGDAISGVYVPTKIVNKFVKGKFTSNLDCYRETLSNPWTGKTKPPASSSTNKASGNASAKGPNNAGTTK
jgi:hypothetical protein